MWHENDKNKNYKGHVNKTNLIKMNIFSYIHSCYITKKKEEE